jgi:hypothetical protein
VDRLCPDCGMTLSVASGGAAGRTLVCPSCAGHLYGLAPFERLLADGVGTRVWIGSAEGSTGGPCPYCSTAMHEPDGDADAAKGIWVCRMCQEIWVRASAADWMVAHARPGAGEAGGAAGAGSAPAECSNCGAPFQPDDDGRCHWCHTQIGAPEPMVVFVPAPEQATSGGFRLF